MAHLPGIFNPLEWNPEGGGGKQLPVGKHVVAITGAEPKVSNKGDSTALDLTLEIKEGSLAGVSGTWKLNLVHPNETAVKIAHENLSKIFHVLGYLQPTADLTPLFHRPFKIEVAPQTKGEGAEKGYTEVVGVFDLNGNPPKRGQIPAQAAPQQGQGFGQQQPQVQQPAPNHGQPAPAQTGWGQQAQTNPPNAQFAAGQPQQQVNFAPPAQANAGWANQGQPQQQPQQTQQPAVNAGWAGQQQPQGGGGWGQQ